MSSYKETTTFLLNLLTSLLSPFIHSFIPMACAGCKDSLPFLGAYSIPLCYIPFLSTLFHQLVFHPTSRNFAIYFLVYLSALLFPNSLIIHFWEFYCLPISEHAQTSIIYLTLLSLLCLHLYFNIHLGLIHAAWYKVN